MELSEKLSLFKNGKYLLLITGKQEAEAYIVFDGKVEKIGSFQVEKPKYSDREGFFETRGKNIYKVGSGEAPIKEKIFQEFVTKFEKLLSEITSKKTYTQVFLFSPIDMMEIAKRRMPVALRKKIKFTFEGDFHHKTHPFQFLEKIKKELEGKRIVLQSEESARLMDRSAKAKGMIRGKKKRVSK